jgi:hypothetical protein
LPDPGSWPKFDPCSSVYAKQFGDLAAAACDNRQRDARAGQPDYCFARRRDSDQQAIRHVGPDCLPAPASRAGVEDDR